VTPTPEVAELIRAKRDGERLPDEWVRSLVAAYSADAVPDYQMAAFLMAVFFRGLDGRELRALTAAMVDSGERLDLAGLGRPTVDKHSTGGVGDKISLVLAPLLAAAGAAVPQLSGRGLGHTGGTLDKLESIPGFRSDLSKEEMKAVLGDVGCVICAAGPGLAPADRRLYRLRDVTATVESIPLIASSIMSKKIAEGTESLVLDVKVGSGAFMQEEANARRLAETMVSLGGEHGVRTTAVLTRMDAPLGRAVGNAVEVAEALETLAGSGPDDVVEVTLALAAEMAALAGIEADLASLLAGGEALARFRAMVRAQGGDDEASLPEAPHRRTVEAEAGGFLTRLDARSAGVAAWRLGAGRAKKEDPVSATAGVICLVKPGEPVEKGQPVLELRAEDEWRFDRALEALEGAVDIGPEPSSKVSAVIDVIRP
jgi:thymidine phosphorylase